MTAVSLCQALLLGFLVSQAGRQSINQSTSMNECSFIVIHPSIRSKSPHIEVVSVYLEEIRAALTDLLLLFLQNKQSSSSPRSQSQSTSVHFRPFMALLLVLYVYYPLPGPLTLVRDPEGPTTLVHYPLTLSIG